MLAKMLYRRNSSRSGKSNSIVFNFFFDKVVRCSCAYIEDVGSPCVHALFSLKHSCKMTYVIDYFHDSWKSLTFINVYSEKSETNKRPIVLKDFLTRSVCDAPSFKKTRGSKEDNTCFTQQATEDFVKHQTK